MEIIALSMGFLGSMHCLGMCGPIAFALPVRTNDAWLKLLKYLLYNFGRITTYSVMGVLVGLLGKGIVVSGIQPVVSISSGIFILLSVFVVHYPVSKYMDSGFSKYVKTQLKDRFSYYFHKKGMPSLFMLGLLNGLLPCGMLYIALMGALSSGSPWSGATFMAAFGLGTMPMMLSVSLLGNFMDLKWKSVFLKATPVLACLVGVLLIMRGLNVAIPYLSPQNSCCHIQGIP